MVVVLTLLLLIVVLAFVGYPLLRPAVPAAAQPTAPAEEQREQLLGERENVLATLKDLELEHSIGNLSDGDYDALRAAQRHKAVAIFRELDRVDANGPPVAVQHPSVLDHLTLDEQLEEEIARARQRLNGTDPDTAPLAPEGRSGPASACPACGTTRSSHDNFCAHCGARLERGTREQ
jgi:hypothetical protein